MSYVPVVDISRYQGTMLFPVAVSKGVRGWIVRATHGRTVDLRLQEYVDGLRAAGVPDTDVGFYTFVNPSRCDAVSAGRSFVDAVLHARGNVDTFYMLDVENYTDPSNLGSLPILQGDAFIEYLEVLVETIQSLAPQARIVLYSNAAYWDVWLGENHSLSRFDIIVPRYLNYKPGAPTPPVDPGLWDEWAFGQNKRPQVPAGWVGWDGWQFSAGYNRMGHVYGASSMDLDLNIVDSDAWSEWTKPAPVWGNPDVVFVEDDMAQLAPELHRFRGFKNVFLFANNTYTHLTNDSTARLRAAGVVDVVLDAHPQGLKSALAKAGLQWADLIVQEGE